MEDIHRGLRGDLVPLAVEAALSPGQGHVATLHHNMAGVSVLEQVLVHNHVTHTTAQVRKK